MSGRPEPWEACPPDPPAPPGAVVKHLPIINQRGLHARASAKFVQTVEKFDAEVRVTRCGETVGGTSITVTATGNESAEVMAALETMVGERFGEED